MWIFRLFNRLGARSNGWRKVRKEWLKQNPCCAICGRKKRVVPHHKKPFHLFPEKELEFSNLITLCQRRKVLNCHLIFGHLGNYKNYNKNVKEDARIWRDKIKNRI